jgi:hypothetical protein
VDYAKTDGTSTAPTVQDYIDADVTGVSDGVTSSSLAKQTNIDAAEAGEANLDEVNAAVAASEPEEVDTTEEIQAIVDAINSGETPPSNEEIGDVTDSDSAANSVAENATVGTTVGITASATDPDESDSITYTLTNSANGLFAINATTGVVTVSGTLDFETATKHTITVKATSTDGSSSTADMTVTVTDVADIVPVLANSNGTVAENAAAGAAVGTVTITSAGDAPITAIALSGTGSENFEVATDGAITVKAGAALD